MIEKLTLIIGGFYQRKRSKKLKVSCLIKYLKEGERTKRKTPARFLNKRQKSCRVCRLFVYVKRLRARLPETPLIHQIHCNCSFHRTTSNNQNASLEFLSTVSQIALWRLFLFHFDASFNAWLNTIHYAPFYFFFFHLEENLTYDNLMLIHISLEGSQLHIFCTFLMLQRIKMHHRISLIFHSSTFHSFSWFDGILILSSPEIQPLAYNSSRHLEFVSIILVKRQTCFEAFSKAPGDLPLNRSMLGRK